MSLVINSNEHVENERNKKFLAEAIDLLRLTHPHDTCNIPCNCAGLGQFEHCDWHAKLRKLEDDMGIGRLRGPSGLRPRHAGMETEIQ
jgi:hypothetical protein